MYLQLTDLALNLVAQTHAQDRKPPCLVRLACQIFSEIYTLSQDNPDLDQGSTVFGLFITKQLYCYLEFLLL